MKGRSVIVPMRNRLGIANRPQRDLGQRPDVIKRTPWLRGARISLAIDNITNAKIGVRDRSSAIPIGYQPDLIDPLGRTLTLSFRKLFF